MRVYSNILLNQVFRGGSRFHPALKIFCVALGLDLLGLLFQVTFQSASGVVILPSSRAVLQFIHGAHFAENGTGLPLVQVGLVLQPLFSSHY